MKNTDFFYTLAALFLFLVYSCSPLFGNGNDDLDEVPRTISESSQGWVYGFVEHEHDLEKADVFYMLLQGHPEAKIPKITGGYATTDVAVFVKLRGVDVGRDLHHARQRHRPHLWQRQERQRWADTLEYLWNLIDQTHTFRIHNLKHIGTELDGDTYEDGILEADMEILLGGTWHNLALMMMQDEMARPIQEDGTLWDAGSREYSLENPNIPR